MADHELHVAQAQSAQSAKQMLQRAYREHLELGQELVALDNDLVSVVSTLASSLASLLDRALEQPSDEQRLPRGGSTNDSRGELREVREEPGEAVRPEAFVAVEAAAEPRIVVSSHTSDAGNEGEQSAAAATQMDDSSDDDDQGVRGRDAETLERDAEQSMRMRASSVFIVSGGAPAELPHLLLSLDVLGIEGVSAELERTEDTGVWAAHLDKLISLAPGTRARAKVVHALADDNQRASDVRFALLASDYEREPVELASALLNLELMLEGARELEQEPLPLFDAEGNEVGSVSISVRAIAALHEIDRALDEHGGSAADMLEAERRAVRAAAERAAEGRARLRRSSSSREALAPLAEEGSELGSESLSRKHSGVQPPEGAQPAVPPEPQQSARSSTASQTAAETRLARPAAPQQLLSPEVERLRRRFHAAAQAEEWQTIPLAGDTSRQGMARFTAVASPTQVCAPPRRARAAVAPSRAAPAMRAPALWRAPCISPHGCGPLVHSPVGICRPPRKPLTFSLRPPPLPHPILLWPWRGDQGADSLCAVLPRIRRKSRLSASFGSLVSLMTSPRRSSGGSSIGASSPANSRCSSMGQSPMSSIRRGGHRRSAPPAPPAAGSVSAASMQAL